MFSWLICMALLIFSITHPETENTGYMLVASGIFAIAGNIAMFLNKSQK